MGFLTVPASYKWSDKLMSNHRGKAMARNANLKVDKLLGYGIVFSSYSDTVKLPPTHC